MGKYDHKKVGEIALALQDWRIMNHYELIDVERAVSLLVSVDNQVRIQEMAESLAKKFES